jgi:hypothetical protein
MAEIKNRYMNLLNMTNEEQVHNEIKKLASDLSDREHVVRSSILDMHAAVEIDLRRIYYHTFYKHLFLTDNEVENKKIIANFEKIIGKLSFFDMWRVLRATMLGWYSDFKSIDDINNVRNQATHSDISKVNYKGRNPFKCADCLAQIYFDVWAIKQSIPKYFWHTVERTEVQLKKYVEKYGEDLLW